MSKLTSSVRFPGESAAYRKARDKLIAEEARLRQMVWDVAALRRALPPGGEVREDYVFEELPAGSRAKRPVRLSELFAAGKPSLILYSFMFGSDNKEPCPLCTSLLDSLDGAAGHVRELSAIAVIAKAPVEPLMAFARARGWRHLRLLSSGGNSYNRDYHGELPDGSQMPMLNVFAKAKGRINHTWASELLYAPGSEQPCHVDMIWPLWNLLDLTPAGRGEDWYPDLGY